MTMFNLSAPIDCDLAKKSFNFIQYLIIPVFGPLKISAVGVPLPEKALIWQDPLAVLIPYKRDELKRLLISASITN